MEGVVGEGLKRSTRTAGVVFLVLNAVLAVANLGSLVFLRLRGSGAYGGISFLPQLLILLSEAAAVWGWAALLRGRRGAWAWLLGVLVLSLVMVLPLWLLTGMFSYFNILMLFFGGELSVLLLDARGGRSEEPRELVRSAGGELKLQTRVAAWVFMAYSLFLFLVFVPSFFSGDWTWKQMLYTIPGILGWPFWLFLLGRRAWAWWVLVIESAVLGVWQVVAAVPHVAGYSGYQMVTWLFMVFWCAMQLGVLLTDRPSGWRGSE